jgi:hypothetical protein
MGQHTAESGLLPQPVRDLDRVDVRRHPPCRFVAPAMKSAVVGATQRDRVLITDPTPQRPRLHKS